MGSLREYSRKPPPQQVLFLCLLTVTAHTVSRGPLMKLTMTMARSLTPVMKVSSTEGLGQKPHRALSQPQGQPHSLSALQAARHALQRGGGPRKAFIHASGPSTGPHRPWWALCLYYIPFLACVWVPRICSAPGLCWDLGCGDE